MDKPSLGGRLCSDMSLLHANEPSRRVTQSLTNMSLSTLTTLKSHNGWLRQYLGRLS